MMDRIQHPRYLLFLAVLAFLASCVRLLRCGDPEVMRREAQRDDANQLLLLLLSGLISVVVLGAMTILILDRNKAGAAEIGLLVATLLASWTFTNLVLTFHYARLYYSPGNGSDHGGLDFPGDEEPDFSDFVNFAFVVGMTCQTADIAITHKSMRRVATFHGLFAFFFNLGVLALVVNVLASVAG